MTVRDVFTAIETLRGWAAETPEGRVMTVAEDPSIVDYVATLTAFLTNPRGWPEITVGPTSPPHSPVDRYRCENEDCPEPYSVWEFRPDDYELDEQAVCCPACGAEAELFFRWFRGGDRG